MLFVKETRELGAVSMKDLETPTYKTQERSEIQN